MNDAEGRGRDGSEGGVGTRQRCTGCVVRRSSEGNGQNKRNGGKQMAESYAKLRNMSLEKLIEEHDKAAPSQDMGVNHYLQEIARRDQDKQTKALLRYTWWIIAMTAVMTVATMVNVFLLYR